MNGRGWPQDGSAGIVRAELRDIPGERDRQRRDAASAIQRNHPYSLRISRMRYSEGHEEISLSVESSVLPGDPPWAHLQRRD